MTMPTERWTDREPWIRYRDSGLYVVPSIHYRLVFAQLVYEACRRKPFDVIAVELPPSYQDRGIVDAYLDLAPIPGVVINPTGKTTFADVPVNDDPDCEETERRLVESATIHPLSPSDSIVMALRCPRLLGGRHKGWKPRVALIDDEHDEDRQEAQTPLPAADDYEVMANGLRSLCDRMDQFWRQVRDPVVDQRRERIMAGELRRFLNQGKEVLFVCGAAHWGPLRELLDSGARDVPLRSRESPAKLITAPLRPELIWLWGWLDDYPRLVWQFEEACHASGVDLFDKAAGLQWLLEQAVQTAREKDVSTSPRRLAQMRHYLQHLVGAAGRFLPWLDGHLVHAAEACVDRQFAEIVKSKALEYPVELPDDKRWFHFVSLDQEHVLLTDGVSHFRIRNMPSPGSSDSRLPIPGPARVSAEEKRKYDEDKKEGKVTLREPPEERELHNRLAARARWLAHRMGRNVSVQEFNGDFGLGPAWRQTIRAMAIGRKSLYVKRHSRRSNDIRPCDGRCPIVWVFDRNCPIAMRYYGIIYSESDPRKAKLVGYSSFYWVAESKNLGAGITQRRIAYAVSLLRGFMPTVDREMRHLKRFLATFPPNRLCKALPWNDSETRHFQGYELAVACAIRHSDDHMVVVALPDQPLSAGLYDYARTRGVRIVRVSRDDFDQDALNRLSLNHDVPAPGNWEAPYDFVHRLVPPVP